MARVKVTTAKSTVEEIIPIYSATIHTTRKISDRSIPGDQYNKRAMYLNSPDCNVETEIIE